MIKTFEPYFKEVADYYSRELFRDQHFALYEDVFAKAGISKESIRLYNVGYATLEWYSFVLKCRELDQTQRRTFQEVAEMGLVRKGTRNYYDTFRGRLIFPITDPAGQITGLIGEDIKGHSAPDFRYQYTHNYSRNGKRIFHRDSAFFGAAQAAPSIQENGKVYLVDSYLEVLAFASRGIFNVLSTGQRPVTAKLARFIADHCNQVVLAFPSRDIVGKLVEYHTDSLMASNLRVSILPGYKPGESIDLNGIQVDNVSFRINRLRNMQMEAPDRETAMLSIIHSICYNPSAEIREKYLAELSEGTGVPTVFLHDRAAKILNSFSQKVALRNSRKR